jgi:SRSO17 transposase
VWTAKATNVPIGTVVADAAYGNECAFREELEAMELEYVVGIGPGTSVWGPGGAPLPPKPHRVRGTRPFRLQRGPGHEPESVKELALALPAKAWRKIVWREGTNAMLSSRFAHVRVRPAHRDFLRCEPHPKAWLLIEWPEDNEEPTKYWLSNLPAEVSMEELVSIAKMRWRIERDYQELKQEFGLGHYEGRGWRGFHHHASLCIAAHAFLLGQRLRKKRPLDAKRLPYPKASARAVPPRAQRHVPDSITTLRLELITKLARRLDNGNGVERRRRKKAVRELPHAFLQNRVANAFRKEDINAIVNMLMIADLGYHCCGRQQIHAAQRH